MELSARNGTVPYLALAPTIVTINNIRLCSTNHKTFEELKLLQYQLEAALLVYLIVWNNEFENQLKINSEQISKEKI